LDKAFNSCIFPSLVYYLTPELLLGDICQTDFHNAK